MATLLLDVRYALRLLARDRGFTAVAVVTMAVAIGGTVTLYSVVDALLLRGLPAPEPDRIVRVHAAAPRTGGLGPLSYPDARDYAAQAAVFSTAAIHRVTGVSVSGDGRAERATAELVSGRYFELLGAGAARGRVIAPDDDIAPLRHPVAVVSDGFWRRYLGAADAVGRVLRVNGHPFTVVGITAPGFRGASDLVVPDLWIPMAMQAWVMPRAIDLLTSRDTVAFDLTARLVPGLARETAAAMLRGVATNLDRAFPRVSGSALEARAVQVVEASRVPSNLRAPVTAFTGLLAAVVLLVLVLTGLNLANLLLARATTRVQELSVRTALGAGRGRLIRQLLTEQIALAGIGGAAGLGVALLLQRLLARVQPPTPVPLALDLRFDAGVVVVCLIVSALIGVACGLAPALGATRGAVARSLRGTAEGGRRGLRRMLLTAQIAGSLVLLSAGGLLLSSLRQMTATAPGFDVERIAIAAMNVGLQGYSEAQGALFFETLHDRVAALPGVRAASFGWTVPMGAAALAFPVSSGPASAEVESLLADYNFVAPDYFDVMGIGLRTGRAIERSDTATTIRVAVVNEALAARLWPGENPVGRRLRLVAREGRRDTAALGLSVPADTDLEVIGVTATVALRALGEPPRPAFYLPFTQWYQTERTLHVRTDAPAAIGGAIRTATARLDADLPLFNEKTMAEHLGRLIAAGPPRRGHGRRVRRAHAGAGHHRAVRPGQLRGPQPDPRDRRAARGRRHRPGHHQVDRVGRHAAGRLGCGPGSRRGGIGGGCAPAVPLRRVARRIRWRGASPSGCSSWQRPSERSCRRGAPRPSIQRRSCGRTDERQGQCGSAVVVEPGPVGGPLDRSVDGGRRGLRRAIVVVPLGQRRTRAVDVDCALGRVRVVHVGCPVAAHRHGGTPVAAGTRHARHGAAAAPGAQRRVRRRAGRAAGDDEVRRHRR